MKIIEKNKKAFFDYEIEEKFEAGIVLEGSEVKSIRAGNTNVKDAFCFIENGEIILKNFYIAPFEKGSAFNPEPRRGRKLLLRKQEIRRLIGKIRVKGYSLIPLLVYFTKNFVKIELGLGKGKKLFDKRDSIKEKDLMRQSGRDIKNL
jgi:SsrA-binding protein